jgi:hypothetical protein
VSFCSSILQLKRCRQWTVPAALVFIGTHAFTFGTREFAAVTVGLTALWLAFAIGVGRRFHALAPRPASA